MLVRNAPFKEDVKSRQILGYLARSSELPRSYGWSFASSSGTLWRWIRTIPQSQYDAFFKKKELGKGKQVLEP
jgi:hypothetical protein